jgi:hypothetical protein
MGNALKVLVGKFDINIGSLSFPISYAQAALIVFLIFILILLMAQFRRHFVDWSLKGALFGIFFGFLLALILEGFLIVGGRTASTKAKENATVTGAIDLLQSLNPSDIKKVKTIFCQP